MSDDNSRVFLHCFLFLSTPDEVFNLKQVCALQVAKYKVKLLRSFR